MAVRLAGVGDRRRLPVRAQGLRRPRRAGHRPVLTVSADHLAGRPAKPDSKWKRWARSGQQQAVRANGRPAAAGTPSQASWKWKRGPRGRSQTTAASARCRSQAQEVGLVGALELRGRHRREHEQPGDEAAGDPAAPVQRVRRRAAARAVACVSALPRRSSSGGRPIHPIMPVALTMSRSSGPLRGLDVCRSSPVQVSGAGPRAGPVVTICAMSPYSSLIAKPGIGATAGRCSALPSALLNSGS